jgi:hypothetical protein
MGLFGDVDLPGVPELVDAGKYIKDVVSDPSKLLGDMHKSDPESTPPKPMSYDMSAPAKAQYSNIFSVVTNTRDTADYVKGSLMDGRDCQGRDLSVGNRFFVKNGKCDNVKSVAQCRGKDRYLYIDNVPTSIMPCLDTSQPIDPNCGKMGNGLFQGVVQDIVHINPFELVKSMTGEGSIVSDECVLRTELVGYQKKGSVRYHSATRCAPARKPLICSMTFDGKARCPLYDLSDRAENERNSSYQPLGSFLVEMTNAQANQVISGMLDGKTATVIPEETMALDKYDLTWKSLCGMVHQKWGEAVTGAYANPPFSLLNCCMADKVQCASDTVLYQWYATIIRPNHEYGFQIKWRVFFNEVHDTALINNGEIIGNPTPIDLDTISGKPSSNVVFEQLEGFSSDSSATPPPYLKSMRIEHPAIGIRPNRPLWTGEDILCCNRASSPVVTFVLILLFIASTAMVVWLIAAYIWPLLPWHTIKDLRTSNLANSTSVS